MRRMLGQEVGNMAGDVGMSEATEAVEGQILARAILDALDQGQPPDWNPFDRAYREPLLHQAAVRLPRLVLPGQTPEDVLHGFLCRQVYPRKQACRMLGPTARGERPLRPRLLTSIANFCIDLARAAGAGRQVPDPTAILAITPCQPREELPDFEEVEDVIRSQLKAIREVCPLRRGLNGAAIREALLVRHRLDWSPCFDGTELRSRAGVVSLDLMLLEQVTVWTNEERNTPLVEGGFTL